MTPVTIATVTSLGNIRRMLSALWLRLQQPVRDQKAAMLMEAIVAVTVLTAVSGTTLIAIQSTQATRRVVERSARAENLARNQIEQIFNTGYQTTTALYPSIANIPGGFQITATQEVASVDTNLQKIVVSVKVDGVEVLLVETMRNND